MKYEIRKRSKYDKDIWITIAWTDCFEYAKEITTDMNINPWDEKECAVFKDGEKVAI
jgi:hypothetical protein